MSARHNRMLIAFFIVVPPIILSLGSRLGIGCPSFCIAAYSALLNASRIRLSNCAAVSTSDQLGPKSDRCSFRPTCRQLGDKLNRTVLPALYGCSKSVRFNWDQLGPHFRRRFLPSCYSFVTCGQFVQKLFCPSQSALLCDPSPFPTMYRKTPTVF